MNRLISESKLQDLIGEVVVGVAGSSDGTNVTREVKVIMRLIKKYSKEQDLVQVIENIRWLVEATEEQPLIISEDIAWEQDDALTTIYGATEEALSRLKV